MAFPLSHSGGNRPARGRGVFSNIYAEELALLGSRPNNKPKGSHAFLVEEMHGPFRSALLKICENDSQWGTDRVPIDVHEAVNDALGTGGLSPSQAVSGHGISDVASVLLGGGDRHQNDDVPQDLRLREAATLDVQRAMNEQRV